MTPPVRLSVGRSVGLSVGWYVVITSNGGKFHFHAPIGALVRVCEFDDRREALNYLGKYYHVNVYYIYA